MPGGSSSTSLPALARTSAAPRPASGACAPRLPSNTRTEPVGTHNKKISPMRSGARDYRLSRALPREPALPAHSAGRISAPATALAMAAQFPHAASDAWTQYKHANENKLATAKRQLFPPALAAEPTMRCLWRARQTFEQRREIHASDRQPRQLDGIVRMNEQHLTQTPNLPAPGLARQRTLPAQFAIVQAPALQAVVQYEEAATLAAHQPEPGPGSKIGSGQTALPWAMSSRQISWP